LSGSTTAILDSPVPGVDQPLKKAIDSLCRITGTACHPFHDAVAARPAIQLKTQSAVAQCLSIALLYCPCFSQPSAVTFGEARMLVSVQAAQTLQRRSLLARSRG